jgi:hypothetical protein
MDSSTWAADTEISITFQQAVAAACLHGVTYNNVIVTSVTNIITVNQAHREDSFSQTLFLRAPVRTEATTTSVLVSYVVSQMIQGYNSSTEAYLAVTEALTSSVSSDEFTAYLQAFALQNDVDSLSLATCSSITVLSYTSAPTLGPTAHSQKDTSLSTGAVAAIAVCAVLGFSVFCLLLCCSAREESSGKKAKNPPAEDAPVVRTLMRAGSREKQAHAQGNGHKTATHGSDHDDKIVHHENGHGEHPRRHGKATEQDQEEHVHPHGRQAEHGHDEHPYPHGKLKKHPSRSEHHAGNHDGLNYRQFPVATAHLVEPITEEKNELSV